jgi:hypothetical protein
MYVNINIRPPLKMGYSIETRRLSWVRIAPCARSILAGQHQMPAARILLADSGRRKWVQATHARLSALKAVQGSCKALATYRDA